MFKSITGVFSHKTGITHKTWINPVRYEVHTSGYTVDYFDTIFQWFFCFDRSEYEQLEDSGDTYHVREYYLRLFGWGLTVIRKTEKGV